MRYALILCPLLLASPAAAGVDEAMDAHILPGYAAFAEESADLAEAAAESCDPAALRPEWNAAFDAWMGVGHINFGPAEAEGRALAIAFWPDTRGAAQKALGALLAEADPIIDTPAGTAELSVAARGLFALEALLYDPQVADGGEYACALTSALSADLAAMAGAIEAEWRAGYADALREAGAGGDGPFLSTREVQQALFTALVAGLEFTADQRLGRPLGTFERPRPARAEAWRSARSLRNVALSLGALHDLANALADAPLPETDAAFARAEALARGLDDPSLSGVATPQGRLEVEIVQQAVHAARDAVLAELGPALGVSTGFNSGDGD